MRGGSRFAGFAIVCAGLLSLVAPAAAQDSGPYQANGVPMGGFRLYPSIGVGANYDDNVYRTQTAAKSDFYFEENPGFSLQSQWGRHQLNIHAAFDAFQYSSLTNES